MKTQLATIALAFFGLTSVASAHDMNTEAIRGPLYDCQLAGNVSGGSIAIGIGGTRLDGRGMVSCRHNLTGEVTRIPVNIKFQGLGVGVEIAKVRSVRLLSAGLGINDPRLFFRSYSLGATAGASLIRLGISADVALRVGDARDGLGFELGLMSKDIVGLGAHLYAMKLKISPVARH